MKALVAAFALVVVASCAKEGKAPRERPPVPVTIVEARTGTLPIEVSAPGTVVPLATVDVAPRVGGQVKSIRFQEGAMVKEGDLLFEIDPEPYVVALARAEANLARDKAQAENADAEAERARQLLERKLVSETEGQATIAAAKMAHATLAATEAEVAAARLDLSWTKVRAPITGRADAKRVSAGGIVAAHTDVVVTLRQLAPIQVGFALPQEHLLAVQQRLASEKPKVTAQLPDHGDVVAEGELTFVAGSVDTATGTIACKADFANADERLWPGAFVHVRLVLGERAGVVLIPSAAVVPGQKGPMVFVAKDGKADMRVVRTGPEGNGLIVVEEGVAAGEQVIVDGQGAIVPGAAVVLKPAVEEK